MIRLAEYERLAHAVTGAVADLGRWLFDEKKVECIVADEAGQLVGYALYFTSFSTFLMRPGLWLEDLFVVPERRAKGLGKELLSAVISEAGRRGYGRVEWSVLDWNQSAIEFYRSMGADLMTDWRICRVTLNVE